MEFCPRTREEGSGGCLPQRSESSWLDQENLHSLKSQEDLAFGQIYGGHMRFHSIHKVY